MKLVIAEKPSVAQSIAAALGVRQRQKGCLEGNGYLISWCFGHLAALADADQYDPKFKRWRKEDLPIVPETFQFHISEEKRNQFELLKSLMHRQDVSEVINACDAGREGELIFRTVYELAQCRKPMKRLWISSMEDEAIREGFANLRPGADFDGLYQSALCRAKADWLVGINATRFFSLVYGTKLSVGRVMSPTLALMVQREAQIQAFVPERFYTVNLDCGFTAASDRIQDFTDATKIADACKGAEAIVQSVERREKTENAPLLYDLTTLQRDANRLLGYTAQQTLDYLQALYEKKLCTYPRTDSRYLTDDMFSTLGSLTRTAASILGCLPPDMADAQRVCDSRKVSDHHAIVPTPSAGTINLSDLPVPEQNILKLICRNVLEATSPAHRWEEVVMKLDCAGTQFTAKGKRVLILGWKAYEKAEEKQNVLPDLQEGQRVRVSSVTVKEGQTTPPKHHTEDTLLSAMETAGDTPENAERRGLGTPATRAGIIEKLISSGLVERKTAKKLTTLCPSTQGTSLITVLPEQLQSPQLTAQWEQELLAIQSGKQESESFLEGICTMLQEMFMEYAPVKGAEVLFPSVENIVGNCPRCGHRVRESPKGFFCSNQDCRFAIWKNNRFFTAKRKVITPQIAASFLDKGESLLQGCYSEKTGKSYDAKAVMEDDGHKTNFRLVFAHE
ncbi:MAG: DNA topoisomerase 3 [Clostridiales bacterium]|nr:DNA topoisomerase 3 [Clostridiales bacterium]